MQIPVRRVHQAPLPLAIAIAAAISAYPTPTAVWRGDTTDAQVSEVQCMTTRHGERCRVHLTLPDRPTPHVVEMSYGPANPLPVCVADGLVLTPGSCGAAAAWFALCVLVGVPSLLYGLAVASDTGSLFETS